MRVSMVIPTYWSRPRDIGWQPGDAIFDHPTPVDTEGTLGRTLKSLEILNNKNFTLYIILVTTTPDIVEDAYRKVVEIVAENTPRGIDYRIFGHRELEKLSREIEEYSSILSLRGYSDVRNMCIVAPFIGSNPDSIIFIDDDEVFEDPGFVDTALEMMGEEIEGGRMWAKAGYYLQPDGDYLVKKPFRPWMRYWNQYEAMNQAFLEFIKSPGRFKVVPFVFGGNMVIHRELFTRIPFDPGVPRGEDIDYLINARFFGYRFYIDTKLSIKHLPPPKEHPIWRQLLVDFERFLWEREKLRLQRGMSCASRVRPEDFDPYPGTFLKDDLEEKIYRATELLAFEYMSKGDYESASRAIENLTALEEFKNSMGDPFDEFLDLQNSWIEFIKKVDADRERLKERIWHTR